jgi:hypothetical protein
MFLKAIFGAKQSKVPATRLPQLHSFVEVSVAGRPTRSVTVEEVGRAIVTRETLGRPGEPAVLVYTTPAGRFRARTRVTSGAKAGMTAFALPERVDLIGAASSGAQKRSSVRLDAILPGQWRFAPSGKGVGEFSKTNLRDISRGGCSLIVERELKKGTMIELRLHLRSDAAPITVLGEVMRSERVPTSGKFTHGIRFHAVSPEEDRAILEFINRKQTELRSRGLA